MEGFTRVSGATENRGTTLTCISCRLLFDGPKEQREHYKSDLHRYNLKRKVAKLPPVSQETFEEKVQSLMNEKKETTVSPSISHLFCASCSKQYSSSNAFNQHIKSKKHLEKATTTDSDDHQLPVDQAKPKLDQSERENIEDVMIKISKKEPEAEPMEPMAVEEKTEDELIEEKIKNSRKLELTECLFCLQKSEDLTGNLEHMAHVHGFFVPDIEYMKDLEGFIAYLGQKVSVGNVCLYCNGKGRSFNTLESVQAHMRDCNHCKILYEEATEEEFGDFYDFSADWEGVPHEEGDEETKQKAKVTLSNDGCELIFDNGKSIGHRSLQIYYKQHYKPQDTRDSVNIASLINQYHTLGWTQKWHRQQLLKNKDFRAEKKQAYQHMRLGVKANTLQRHFRDQLLQ